MKSSFAVLSFVLLGGIIAAPVVGMAKSLITIQEFPKTYADVPFAQRIENEDMGYDEWDSVYDENGICISGCAYYGIRLQDELEMMENATNQLAADLRAEEQRGGPSSGAGAGGGAGGAGGVFGAGIDAGSDGTYTCKTGKYSAHANESGFISPLDRDLVVTSVVGLRNVKGGSRVHRGIDLRAYMNTPLYAAFQGTVVHADWSAPGAGGGKYVKIKHEINGRTYYTFYMHMNEIKVAKGNRIAKGCFIGYSGASGNNGINSTSPHLHYEIRTTNNIAIDPLGSCIIPETPNVASGALSKLAGKNKRRFESLKSGNAIHAGENFLARPYCLRTGQTSPVVQACESGNIDLSRCFPGVTGWCK